VPHPPSRERSQDVIGDGSLVLLPTPGHTPGSLSLLIRSQLANATDQVLALKERMPDLVILPAHDPTAAQRLLES
jgi:glyoxylase-like metal-dependent hydrolase (beta-lactamase superfamily II)